MWLDMLRLSISCSIHVAALSSIAMARLTSRGQDDYTLLIPDELMSCIFETSSLTPADRKRISLVCLRWYKVEARGRQRLTLFGYKKDLIHQLPSIFSRFDSVVHIVLHSMDDDNLRMISKLCGKIKRLEFSKCCRFTDDGMSAFVMNCQGLKELHIEDCTFGSAVLNCIFINCPSLEHLSVRDLKFDTKEIQLIRGPRVKDSSLKSISLSALASGTDRYFAPLIISSKQLEKFHLYNCLGDWRTVISIICNKLKDVRLDRISFTQGSLAAIASCTSLERLHIADKSLCSNIGIRSIAEGCRNIRKLHINGKYNTFRNIDEGLLAIAQHCPNIEELVYECLNLTDMSLNAIASNCLKLEQMTFCKCNAEIACMADKCVSLKKLTMEQCPISDKGIKSLASGFPNLQVFKVSECKGMSKSAADWLESKRPSLLVSLCLRRWPGSVEDLGTWVANFFYLLLGS